MSLLDSFEKKTTVKDEKVVGTVVDRKKKWYKSNVSYL